MRTALAALAALALAALPGRPHAAPRPVSPQGLAPDEREACAADVEVIQKREALFAAQGLPPGEIARRNETALAALDQCLHGYRLERTAARERDADIAELERRAGPDATDEQRTEAWAQIRRERLSSKPVGLLTADERAELHAGNRAELAETHATLDTVHARDPAFMRMVHSSLACYHGVRRDQLRDELRREEALQKSGQGSKKRVYALKSELRISDEVLARSREAAKEFKEGLGRCTEQKVAVLAHCLAIRFEEGRSEAACESEEIQQYVRFIK